MSDSLTGVECDYCHDEAWYRVSTIWTVYDFIHDFVCFEHYVKVLERRGNQVVDGQRGWVATETLPPQHPLGRWYS